MFNGLRGLIGIGGLVIGAGLGGTPATLGMDNPSMVIVEPTLPEVLPSATDIAAHNAWLLTCSALVLLMTAPGLALFYGGLVRKKNVVSVLMQCLFLMSLMTVVWSLYGYSLAFGNGGNGTFSWAAWTTLGCRECSEPGTRNSTPR